MTAASFLDAARIAARQAGEILMRYYRADVEVRLKPDRTPVTRADVEAEESIRELLMARFPDHGFFGEESGSSAPDAEYQWLVDPLDGTKSFVRGYPFFSTQIALMHRQDLILGVSCAPAFEETAWAVRGEGARLNGRPLEVSAVTRLEDATISTGNIGSLAADPARWRALGELLARADRCRGFGDFYHYHLLAAGRVDAVIESDLNILDIAALAVIVTEAGGVFTDLEGRPPGMDTRSALAATPALHGPLKGRLAGSNGP